MLLLSFSFHSPCVEICWVHFSLPKKTMQVGASDVLIRQYRKRVVIQINWKKMDYQFIFGGSTSTSFRMTNQKWTASSAAFNIDLVSLSVFINIFMKNMFCFFTLFIYVFLLFISGNFYTIYIAVHICFERMWSRKQLLKFFLSF